MTDSCSGHCCRNFTLPFSPAELKASYRAVAALSQGLKKGPNDRVLKDMEVWWPHLIYKGYHPRDANGDPSKVMQHHYTCALFDTQYGLCKAYEHRPEACRTYPNSVACAHHECTWRPAKEGRVQRNGDIVTMEKLKGRIKKLDAQEGIDEGCVRRRKVSSANTMAGRAERKKGGGDRLRGLDGGCGGVVSAHEHAVLRRGRD